MEEAGGMNDRKLIKNCKRVDTDALREIYEMHRDHLLILAVTLTGDTAAAEDILHDVFVGFVRNIETFRLTGSLRAYLSVCTANRARNWRKSASRRNVSLDNQDPVDGLPDPAEQAICNEWLHQLSEAMSQLPCEQREVVALSVHSRMRFRRIAQSLGISVNTVKSRYRYGILKLRSILNGKVVP